MQVVQLKPLHCSSSKCCLSEWEGDSSWRCWLSLWVQWGRVRKWGYGHIFASPLNLELGDRFCFCKSTYNLQLWLRIWKPTKETTFSRTEVKFPLNLQRISQQNKFTEKYRLSTVFCLFSCCLFNHVYLKIDSYMTIHSVEFIVKRAGMINDSSEIMDSYCY